MIFFASILACQTEKTDDSLAPDTLQVVDSADQSDSANTNVEGCEPNNADFEGLAIQATAAATVPKVQWSGAAAELLYSDGRGIERRLHSSNDSAGLNAVLPLGLRPNQSYTAQLVRRNGDEIESCSEPLTLTTTALPASFPEVDITATAVGDDGFVVTSILSLDASFLVVFDAEGEVVWAVEEPNQIPEGNHFPVKVVTYDPYRNQILFSRWQNTDFCGQNGFITWMDWAGTKADRWTVPGLRVGMTQLDESTVAVLRCENDPNGLEEDILSVVTENGFEDIWRATDTFPEITESELEISWVHTNFLHALSPEVLLMSMERVQSVGAFNLQRRDFDWRLSSKSNDGTYQSTEVLVDRPHSVTPFDGGYLIYNRSSIETNPDECAHVRYVTLDDANHMAESPWRIDFDPCGPLGFFGDVITSDAHIIVIWSDRGQMNYYDAVNSHESHVQMNLPIGYAFTFGSYISWAQLEAFNSNH